MVCATIGCIFRRLTCANINEIIDIVFGFFAKIDHFRNAELRLIHVTGYSILRNEHVLAKTALDGLLEVAERTIVPNFKHIGRRIRMIYMYSNHLKNKLKTRILGMHSFAGPSLPHPVVQRSLVERIRVIKES